MPRSTSATSCGGAIPALRHVLATEFGDDAQHLIVEALVEEGVVASPLSKYLDFNIRVCRPYNLRREDLRVVLDDVIVQIGYRYDVKNLIDLARYFLPVSLVPRRFRRQALAFGSGVPTQVICSSLIAHAFDKVRYPILPDVTADDDAAPRAPRSWFGRKRLPIARPLPDGADHAHDAARLRHLALLRGRQVQHPRGHALRLPPDPLGGVTRARALARSKRKGPADCSAGPLGTGRSGESD